MASRKTPPKSAAPFLPKHFSLRTLREAAASCEGCDLYLTATQTVFGEGPESAQVVFVGEQPGDAEDLQGRPFVGPAGKVLSRALEEAGVSRERSYVTNAVKHFSFEPRGKARLHKRPRVGEVRACGPWLRAELSVVKPQVLVLLGATAAQAVWGASFRLSEQRGVIKSSELAPAILATFHPSAVLRAPDSAGREEIYQQLVADLRHVAKLLQDRED